jgi:serine/threonine-protein kinase
MTPFEQQLRDSLSHLYDIERELGGGGMSRVFVATDKSLGRKIVIKVLSPELTADVNRGRFRREIQVAAQLQHPHIVTLLSAGEDGDLVYYTMPFIKGESLKSTVEREGPMRVSSVVRVLNDVLDALAYAHENGVVHRDIKPANILASGSHSLVTDFGVAKALNAARSSTSGMTATGMAIGTPAYMSPEQLAGDPKADHRIDIYAVGLLAYELLAGKSPFAAATPRHVLANVLTREPKPLIQVREDVPQALSDMVMSSLSKDPDGRPESADVMLATLDLFAGSGEIRTREYRVPGSSSLSTPVTNPSTTIKAPTPTSTMKTVTPTSAGKTVQARTATPASATKTLSARVPTPTSAEIAAFRPGHTGPVPVQTEEVPPKKGSKKFLIAGAALLIPVIAVGIYLSQQSSSAPAAASVTAAVTDSVQQSTIAQSQVPAVVPRTDSQALADSARIRAVRDSLKKRAAAKADSLKKLAAAKADSALKKDQTLDLARSARGAAGEMLANTAALEQFNKGASHIEGILKRQRGDLQTQINALQPFLAKRGLTYEQFKAVAQESGVSIYDEYGRMVVDQLRRFANLAN